MRVVVLSLAALTLLGGCLYIKVDDSSDERARSGEGDREIIDCAKPDAAGCKPE